VRHVAEAHRGRVTVESEPGHGSRFTLWLPLA
jgi:signal transduction histidine kinase